MYILEGNIGVGKSTFLKLVTKYAPHILVVLEPIDNWQSQTYGQSLLAHFYHDPKRWAYTLETLTMMCRVKNHIIEQNNSYPYRIVERSVYSGNYCFARNGYVNGFMTDIEWEIYNRWFTFLVPGKCQIPHGFIYLKVDPTIAYERIKKRNRLSEKEITLSYLQQIDISHEDFLIHKKDFIPELEDIPVLSLDCNKAFESNMSIFNAHLSHLQQFIDDTYSIDSLKQKTYDIGKISLSDTGL